MILKIQNVSKRFDEQWVLRDVTLEVAKGEIFGLLGESGAGKTALLNIVAGRERADSGAVTFDDAELSAAVQNKISFPSIENQSNWKSKIGFRHAFDKSSNSAREISLSNKYLSGDPALILIDNNFCSLGETARGDFFRALREKIQKQNVSAIIATNRHENIFEICDRAALLINGTIEQIGMPRELYEKPETVAAAKLVGRNNFVEARRLTFNNQQIQEFQTLIGNHRLVIGKTENRSLGAITDTVTLAIRPEHISISFGASFPEDNLLKAKITDVRYLGATTRITLSADDLLLEALVLRLVGLNVGDECMVGLPPDRIHVLKN